MPPLAILTLGDGGVVAAPGCPPVVVDGSHQLIGRPGVLSIQDALFRQPAQPAPPLKREPGGGPGAELEGQVEDGEGEAAQASLLCCSSGLVL